MGEDGAVGCLLYARWAIGFPNFVRDDEAVDVARNMSNAVELSRMMTKRDAEDARSSDYG